MVERYLDEHGFGVLVGYKGAVVPFLSKLFYDNSVVVPIPAWLPRLKLRKDNNFSSCCWWHRLFRHRGGQR